MSDCGFFVSKIEPDPKTDATGNKLYLAVSLSGALPKKATRKRTRTTARTTGARSASTRNRRNSRDAPPSRPWRDLMGRPGVGVSTAAARATLHGREKR